MSANGAVPKCDGCRIPATCTTLFYDAEVGVYECGWCRPDLKRLHQIEDRVLNDSHTETRRV